MAIRLFAHTLRTANGAIDGGAASFAARPLEFCRWVLDELVGRRCEPIAWGLQQPATVGAAAGGVDVCSADSIWADTQPWCHE